MEVLSLVHDDRLVRPILGLCFHELMAPLRCGPGYETTLRVPFRLLTQDYSRRRRPHLFTRTVPVRLYCFADR
jgi:hypothetical protein